MDSKDTVTIAPHHHESIKARLKEALITSGHVSAKAAEGVASIALETVLSGAFGT